MIWLIQFLTCKFIKKSFFLLLSFFLIFLNSDIYAQLVISNTLNPQQLVQNVLVGGGVTTSAWSYTGGANSKGTFTNGALTNLGLNSGIVLCTGTASLIDNPASYFMSLDLGLAGDAQLNAINNGTTTHDASILEFDFIPLSDTVKFRYVFGSEEYPNWVCSQYQDIFAFFVTGPNPAGGNYTNYNIALIPGTALPVSVNSVNNGSVGSSVSTGPGGCISLSYSNLYVSNAPSGNAIAFNGFTTPLTAWCKVTPCQTYHMKLAVADGYNGLYDSGVFIEANSFTANTYTVSESYSVPSLGNNAVEGCSDGIFTFTLPSAATSPVTIVYTISGSAINGTDYSLIQNSVTIPVGQSTGTVTVSPANDGISEGTETVILNYMNGCNPESDTVYIIDNSPISLTMGGNVTTCSGGSATISVTPNGGTSPFTYLWNNSVGTNSSASVTPSATTIYTVTVTDHCGSTSTGSQTVTISTLTTNAGNDQTICSGNSATLTSTNGGSYLWSNGGNVASISVSPAITTTYIVTVTSGVCVAVDSVVVNVIQMPVANAGNNIALCSLTDQLQATPSVGTGIWTVTGPGSITFGDLNSAVSSVTATNYGIYSFTWTENNGSGCISTDNVNINFAQTPVANAGTNDSTCLLSYQLQAVPSVGIGTWTQLLGPGTSSFINTHLATTTVTVSTNGNYTFQWIELNSLICSDTDQVDIAFNAQPIANAGVDGQICSLNYSLNATPSFGVGTWSVISGPGVAVFSDLHSATSDVTVSVQGNYLFSWTEANNSCSNSDNVNISFAIQPTANAGIDSVACSLSYVLNAVPSSGIGTWTYTGPGTALFTNIHSSSSNVTVNTSGAYIFIWTENNGLGCISSDSVNITFSQPIANAGQNISICLLSTNLAAIPSIGLGTWSQVSGMGTVLFDNPNNPNALASASQQGTYVLQWLETNGGSCSSSDNMTIIFTELPVANAGIDSSVCSQSYTMTATPSVGTGTWNQLTGPGTTIFSDIYSSSSMISVVNYGVYAYVWNENNGNGCFDNDTVEITLNYVPNSNFQFTSIDCYSSNSTITYTGNGTINSNYSWNFGSANIVSGSGMGPYVINYSTSGIFPVSLQVSQTGCVSTITLQNLTNPTDIIISHTKTNVTCFGSNNGNINISINGGNPPYTYLWSNGSIFSSLANISAGFYTLTVTDNSGCTSIDTATILEPAKFVIDITEHYSICSDSSVTIGSAATGGVFPYTYLWNNSMSSMYITVSPDTTTSYFVNAIDANGCVSTSSALVSVFPPLYLSAHPSIDSICPGEMVAISASASGGDGNYSYSLNGISNTIPFVIYPSATQSNQVMVNDGCNYSAVENILTVVYPSPPNNPSSDKISGCDPLAIQFNESSSGNDLTYYWNFGDGEAAYIKNPLHNFNSPGSFDVALTTTNNFGCVSYNLYPDWITVYPLPEAQFETNPEFASIITPIITFTNYSSITDSVMWYFGDGDSSSLFNPVHQYPTSPTGIYDVTLIVFTSQGCSDTIHGKVEIKDEFTFYAPTAFSPDHDGKNELFFVTGNGISEETFHLAVFDRWGEMIFETNDILKGWDGKVKGRDIAPVGTYTWFATFRDFKLILHEKAGPITLIR